MKKFFIYILTFGFSLGIPFILGLFLSFSIPPPNNGEVLEVITIPSGARLKEVISVLHEKNIIRSQILFNLLVRWQGGDTMIKAGEYQFSNRMLPNEVLKKLIRGEQVKYSVTIPEGLTIAQIADLLEKAGMAGKNKFIGLSADQRLISSLNLSENTLEGFLFPDTYKFIRNIGEESIIRSMVQRFNEIYNQQFRERERELNLTRTEVITLASLIEKEAKIPKERPLISAVFHNRLKCHMPLQCDSTVIFGIEQFNGNLTKSDLKTPTPYNTYINHGLPPTPISNPGLNSIKAALYPEDVHYLYFVSRNDGTHYFSSSLSEHDQAVNKYQKNNHNTKSE